MAGRSQNSTAPLGNWLRSNSITITQLAEDAGIAYRTAWLAAHGYRISFPLATKIFNYTGKSVTVEALCSGVPRNNDLI